MSLAWRFIILRATPPGASKSDNLGEYPQASPGTTVPSGVRECEDPSEQIFIRILSVLISMGFGKDGRGQILYDQISAGIGTIAANDVSLMGGRYDGSMLEDFRIIKMDYWITLTPAQAITVLDGPITIGIASGDLTSAEIEEAIEAAPLGNSDVVANARSMRPVWPLESYVLKDPDTGGVPALTRKGSINIRWTFPNPTGWTYWAFNHGAGTLTTGNNIFGLLKLFGLWVA